MGRFFTFKAIFAFFSPQRCDEQLPEDAPYGCEMISLALSFFSLSLRILGRCIFLNATGQNAFYFFTSFPSTLLPLHHPIIIFVC
jgi:hypothetical protein